MPVEPLSASGAPAPPAPALDPASPLTAGCAVALVLDRLVPTNLGSVGGAFGPPGPRVAGGAVIPFGAPVNANVAAGLASSVAYATPSGAFTLWARVRIDAEALGDQANIMSLYGDEGGDASFQVRLNNDGTEGGRRKVHGPLGAGATLPLPIGPWSDLALTYDGFGNCVHYLNGATNGASADAFFGGSVAATMRIGTVAGYRRPFLGAISDLRVWHGRTLDAGEIAALHADPRAGILDAPPLPTRTAAEITEITEGDEATLDGERG